MADGRRMLAVNPAFLRVSGYEEHEVLACPLGFNASGEQDESFFAAMLDELARMGRWSGEIWQRRKSGEAYPEKIVRVRIGDADSRAGYLTMALDVSPSKDAERLLTWQANHPLTKLPNRTLMHERLMRLLVRQSADVGAVLSIDIDGFKRMNDVFGPANGDRLLMETTIRLALNVNESDTVARFGSDEFVVLLAELSGEAAAGRTARRILDSFRQPFQLEGREVYVTASIGVAMFPDDGTNATELTQ